MKFLWLSTSILVLLVTGLGYPTLAGNDLERKTWNLEHTAGDNIWTQCSQGMRLNANISALLLSPAYAKDHTLFAGAYDGGVFKSTDSGASWSTVGFTYMYV
jgi:hypothetical protein